MSDYSVDANTGLPSVTVEVRGIRCRYRQSTVVPSSRGPVLRYLCLHLPAFCFVAQVVFLNCSVVRCIPWIGSALHCPVICRRSSTPPFPAGTRSLSCGRAEGSRCATSSQPCSRGASQSVRNVQRQPCLGDLFRLAIFDFHWRTYDKNKKNKK